MLFKISTVTELDWLKSRGVRVCHNLSCIHVHETYIRLVDDTHIASIGRIKTKVKIPPQTVHVCQCKVRNHLAFLTEKD